MTYTKHGLKIPLDELRKILEQAENQAEFHNMESFIYISGDKPKITQYCCYAECNSINYTINV